MIAVDTNVLARYVVGDDPGQLTIASRFIETELTANNPGFVSLVVLVELAWVLRQGYGVTAPALTAIVRTLLETPSITVEAPELVERAIFHLHDDFADALIHELGRRAGCSRTMTFDRRFARTPGVELLRPQNG